MGETVKFLDVSISKEMYEAERNSREYLEKFIGESTIDRIRTLEVKAAESDELRIRLEEKEKAYDDLKKSFDDRMASAVRNAERSRDREWQAIQKQSLSDQRKNIRSKEVKPEKERTKQVEDERDRIKEMYDSLSSDHSKLLDNQEEMLTVLKSVYSVVMDIKDSIGNGGTFDKVSELVEIASDELSEAIGNGAKPSEDDKIAICREIKQLKDSGMTNKEVAKTLMKSNKWFMSMSSINAAEQKVARYIKSKYYNY